MKPDLSDADFQALDALLARTPEPLHALDVVMLDGYLCGVLVQPVLIDEAQWLAPIFDLDRQPLSADVDSDWLARCRTLIRRRHGALNRALAEDGWFEPLIAQAADGTAADGTPAGEASADDDWAAQLPAVSRPLAPWVAGFDHAMVCFPTLEQSAEGALDALFQRVNRHLPVDLPAEPEYERERRLSYERAHPLASVDAAIDDLVQAVVAMWDITSAQRYAVPTVRRTQPKVGRNDPCPCGSGRKFKLCHGA